MALNSLNLANNFNSLITFGENNSIQISKSPEKIDNQNPINNSHINPRTKTNKKINSYSSNSDDDLRSQED